MSGERSHIATHLVEKCAIRMRIVLDMVFGQRTTDIHLFYSNRNPVRCLCIDNKMYMNVYQTFPCLLYGDLNDYHETFEAICELLATRSTLTVNEIQLNYSKQFERLAEALF